MKKSIPTTILNFFWDVQKDKLDLRDDQKLIIKRVLKYGDLSAWRWLFNNYPAKIIKEVALAKGRSALPERTLKLFILLTK